MAVFRVERNKGYTVILTLAGARLLFATAATHSFETVTAVFSCVGADFTARGKTVLAGGWKDLERRYRATLKNKPEADDEDSADGTLPELAEGQSFDNPAAKVTEHDTTPPKPHNEASLLSAMERAGNEDTDPDAERKGLGTPATRAAVIEKLVSSGFVERKGKQLIPTKDGNNLVCILPDNLTSPKLTAEWENNLTQIAKGAADPSEFLSGIEAMARELVKSYVTQENGRAKMGAVLFTGTPQKCRELMGQLKSGELTEGQVKELYAKAQETAKTAEQDRGTFSIYQLKHGDETRDLRFEPYDRLQATGNVVDKANYELVYSAELTPGTSLEDIYTRFNIDHPKDFKGHSLSVSDVVVLHQNGQDAAHYVDSFGYKNVPEFLQEQKQLTPDELETGETIKTPRGTFYVTDMSREQMEAAGYGFHHQSDDGKYLVMGNGTRAFAIAAEQRENPLKAAEQTTEQNENMIDGIINNTPTVDELEAKVKAGETISLVDLANAVKADKERGKGKPEKKPSIRAQLKADKEKAQKKAAAKTKNHDLEV